MKRLLVFFAVLVILVACGETTAPPTPTVYINRGTRRALEAQGASQSSGGSCSASEYKTQATAQMNRLQSVMQGIDLSNKSAIAQEKREVSAILGSINSMSCRNAFPLKQETLEYSARHFLDVLKHAESGDLAAMQTAINRMELNVDTFYDWSVDMK